MEPEILFPEIKISRANPNTRSRRRRLHKKAKIQSFKIGGKGDEDVNMGPSSSDQFDAPPPSQVKYVAAELIFEDDAALKMMPFSSEQLSDAPPPPIIVVTSSSFNSKLQSGKVLPEKKRIKLASSELKRCSYNLRSRRNS